MRLFSAVGLFDKRIEAWLAQIKSDCRWPVRGRTAQHKRDGDWKDKPAQNASMFCAGGASATQSSFDETGEVYDNKAQCYRSAQNDNEEVGFRKAAVLLYHQQRSDSSNYVFDPGWTQCWVSFLRCFHRRRVTFAS